LVAGCSPSVPGALRRPISVTRLTTLPLTALRGVHGAYIGGRRRSLAPLCFRTARLTTSSHFRHSVRSAVPESPQETVNARLTLQYISTDAKPYTETTSLASSRIFDKLAPLGYEVIQSSVHCSLQGKFSDVSNKRIG